MKKCLVGSLLIAGICGAVFLPSVFAADTQGKQNRERDVETTSSQIEIRCQITMTDAAGKSQIVAAPRVVAYEGKTATVAITQDNGESIEIQLIGRLHHDARTDEAKAARPNRK